MGDHAPTPFPLPPLPSLHTIPGRLALHAWEEGVERGQVGGIS